MKISYLLSIFLFASFNLIILGSKSQHSTTETDETKKFHDLSGADGSHIEGHVNPNDPTVDHQYGIIRMYLN